MLYDKNVDWESFDSDDNEMIDLGMELLDDYLVKKDVYPNPDFLRTMFIDEFDGFEDVEGAVKNAIVVKAMERWEELHPDKARNKDGEAGNIPDDHEMTGKVSLSDFVPGDFVEVSTHWNGSHALTRYKGVVIAYDANLERLIVTFDCHDPSVPKMTAWIDSVTPDEVVSIRKILPTMPVPAVFTGEVALAAQMVRDYEDSGSQIPGDELLETLGLLQVRAGLLGLDEEEELFEQEGAYENDDDVPEGFSCVLSDEELDELYADAFGKDSLASGIAASLAAFENIMRHSRWGGSEPENEVSETPVEKLFGAIDQIVESAGISPDAIRRDVVWTYEEDVSIATATISVSWLDDDGLHLETKTASTGN